MKPLLLSQCLFCRFGTKSFGEPRAAVPSGCTYYAGSTHISVPPPLGPGKVSSRHGPSLNPWHH